MERIYRRSPIAVLLNFICMGFGIGVLFVLLGYFFGLRIAQIGAGICGILILIGLIRQARMRVVVGDNRLSICLGRKEYHYQLDSISLQAERINNSSFTLYVTDEKGHKESFDLSMLGLIKYHRLLDDLGVTGDKSTPQKIEVTKKSEP